MGAWLSKHVNSLFCSRFQTTIDRETEVPDSDSSESMAKLCEVCSKLDIHRLTNPFHPCRKPLPCSTPPVKQFDVYLALGSVDAIKSRRFACDVCRLVAECLDKEPEGLDGECRITESAEFCNFKLPTEVLTRDPSITHIHLTQASVIFDTIEADQFQGPSLPWELKARDSQSTHYILNFQVKAKSCVDSKNTSVSPPTEEEFLDTIGGKYVGTQVNAQLIRAWLHQCESEHGKECMPSVGLPPDIDRQPTFVIDVIKSCLVDTPLQCRYIALSYVWGTDPVFKHLTGNTKDIRKTGSLQSLPIPATIRDSITLVHAIGERYLWVDSLCIIQDDLKMQQEEIKRMTAVYSKALFTIIAAAGNNANSGLPGVEQGSRNQVQKILKLANCELLTVIDIRKTPSGIEDTTIWAQRAWTFQERILSNRVLVFSENQIYWSCRSATHSEERALEDVLNINRLHLVFPQRPVVDWFSWTHLQPKKFWQFYGDLLAGYRQRRLTYETDMLNAFSGVSHIVAAVQNDTFFWGLPESMFSCGMTWFFTGHSVRNYVEVSIFQKDGSKQVVPFPSWSWAAWSAIDPNSPPFLQPLGRHLVHPITDFYIVDEELQLVRIKEQSWESQPNDGVRALWQDKRQSHSPPTLSQYPLPRIGHLYFWTSFATTRAYKINQFEGQGQARYVLLSVPNIMPDLDSEIVTQDFIVVAESDSYSLRRLILLAIEWKDGVAYRTDGDTEIAEADWVRVENREWRLITLG